MNRDEIRRLALYMYASARRIERLPRETHYEPRDVVELVKVPTHLEPALAIATLVSPRYEEI